MLIINFIKIIGVRIMKVERLLRWNGRRYVAHLQ